MTTEKHHQIAVTICALNYLGKALVLRDSFLRQHQDSDFLILLIGRKDPSALADLPGVEHMWVEDLGVPEFSSHAFKFDLIELSTNVKPTILRNLLIDYQKVLYIDPDIQVFRRLTRVLDALDDHSIVVTPHATTPVLDGRNPSDVDFSRFGSFNLGFIGVSRNAEAEAFLDWWSERCLKLGYYEPQLGLAVDQKWVDLAPCFFPGLEILRDPGLNVAFWNLHERRLSRRGESWFVNDEHPLYFFHFSSFSQKNPGAIANKQSRWKSGSRPDCEPLMQEYAHLLKQKGEDRFSDFRYSFDYFEDGLYISPTLRRIYATLEEDFPKGENPFKLDSAFYRFASRKGLAHKRWKPAPRETFKDMGRYSSAARLINMGLRICLKILGPNRYFAFMRYLSYVSSIRNQRDLFKVRL